MDRNSNLEHLWDFAMPSKDKYRRSLMYKSSSKKTLSRANGGTTPNSVDVIPEVQQDITEFKTYLPTHERTKGQARFYTYKQKLDSALSAKNPDAWKKVSGLYQYNEDTPIHERLSKAQEYIQNKTFPYSLSEEEMKTVLGEDYEDFNTLRGENTKLWGLDVAGSGEKGDTAQQTAYGLRNSWSIPNPRYSRPIYIKGEHKADIEGRTTYDPTKKSYQYSYSTKQIKKSGGLLRVNTKPSERETRAQDNRDKDKTSLRKPNAVPGAINKTRSHRQ